MNWLCKLDWATWVKGIWASVIGGVASSLTTWGGLSVFTPDVLKNLDVKAHLNLMGLIALFSGLSSLVFFLKQSPVPPEKKPEAKP